MALQSIDAHLIMHLHWLQHVPFEGLGMIQSWAAAGGHSLGCTRFWAADKLPEPDSMDMLIVMGGPMGVNDEGVYPWLVLEKNFIRRPARLQLRLQESGVCSGRQDPRPAVPS